MISYDHFNGERPSHVMPYVMQYIGTIDLWGYICMTCVGVLNHLLTWSARV